MSDDGQLLREYYRSGSEAAFAELVRRHLDLVYSAALRTVGGDEFLAKDVSQSVFIDLARKAERLAGRPVLTGWLYTSACFAAAKAVRSERRRHCRELEAQAVQEKPPRATPEPDWDRLGPVLDRVMLELRETDREALLLRFFQGQSLAEVGQRLGVTENAARMRIERALERLRALLAHRGITSTAAVLTGLLTSQAVGAAPVGLAAAITTASLATAVSGSGSTLLNYLVMSKLKTTVIGMVLATGLAAPLLLQHQANLRLKAEIAMLQAQLAERSSAPPPRTASDATELARLRSEEDELVRLRGEVALLRQRAADRPKASVDPAEAERNQAARWAADQAQGQALLAKSPNIPIIPANSWEDAGAATPAAALQTLNWAVRNHNTNAFAAVLGWDPPSSGAGRGPVRRAAGSRAPEIRLPALEGPDGASTNVNQRWKLGDTQSA